MAIDTSDPRADSKSLFAEPTPEEGPRTLPSRVPKWVAPAGVVVGLVLLVMVLWNWLRPATAERGLLTQRIARSDLVITVTEDGAVESASNVDVKCEVAGGSTILWIIPDGSEVAEGDELVRLDSSTIEDQVSQQKILVERALAARIQAEKEFAAAKIAVQEYLEGTFVKELQTAQGQITITLGNLRSAQNAQQHAERMARKGYITALQRDAQAFAVERSKLELAVAETTKDVLERFTRAKMVGDLESLRDSAGARMSAEQAAFDLEDGRLKRLTRQLESCIIKAPAAGMVVYANESRGRFGQQGATIEEGAAVRERQSLIRLPDLAKMQVKVTVHESKVDSLKRGMRARIRVQDRELQGTVHYIANQAEPTSFFSASVKEFATIVRVDGQPTGLRPGMTASVEILVADQPAALTVPVHAVVEQGGKFYCWVNKRGTPERRPLVLGLSNDQVVEVKDGLSEGDDVLLNPRALVAEARAMVEAEGPAKVDVKAKFGEAPAGFNSADEPGGRDAGGKAFGTGREGSPSSGDGAQGPNGGDDSAKKKGNFDLMKLDADGDKKISRAEAPERLPFDLLDTNQDGFITPAEAAAARKRFQQMQQQGGAPGGPTGGP